MYRNLRILQVLPALNFGGVETETLIIAKAIVENGDMSFVASQGGVQVSKLEANGSQHITLPLNTKNPIQMLINAFSIIMVISKLSIDIIHVRSRRPAWSVYLASLLTRTPFITTMHGAHKSQNWFKNFFNSVMVRGCKVIAISKFIRQYILDNYQDVVKHENIIVINRGIDLDKFKPKVRKEGDIFKILLPARYSRIKGHDVAIKAMTYLDNVQMICTGPIGVKKDYYQQLQKLVQTTDTKDKVQLLEDSHDIPQLMSECDLVICPSIVPEAFGRTIAEAGAMGIPVVASNIGAPGEILIDGVTGFLVEPNNPQALAAAINNARQPLDMVKARKNIEQHYSLQNMCASTLKLYQEVING